MNSDTGVLLWILRNFKEYFFYRTPPGGCFCINPDGIYLLKVTNINIRIRCEICSKLTIYFTPCSSVSIVNFEHVFSGWKKNFCAQKQSTRGVPKKKYSENMQQICRGSSMPKCDFNKVASTCKATFPGNTSGWLLLCVTNKVLPLL